MTYKIGKIELTTDHASSSYGLPVAVIDGEAYGCSDATPGLSHYWPVGAALISVLSQYVGVPAAVYRAVERFVQQDQVRGDRWADAVCRMRDAARAEFADEAGGSVLWRG